MQEWKDIWPKFLNASLKRQFKLYSVLGTAALSPEKFARLTTIIKEMGETYSKGKICHFKNSTKCDLSLEPDITNILKLSRDDDELVHVWKSWRDAVGKPNKKLYEELIQLSNEAAILNGFPSMAEMWLDDFESDSFENDIHQLIQQLSPLYKQLHAYTRRKLREFYGENKVPKREPISAELLGNMWAQDWSNIYDILIPYPNKTSFDVTEAMKEQGYTPRLMFEKADDFFASLGLDRVTDSFWNNSIIEKPLDRDIVCHASAWDFSDTKDFRIKQCTDVNMEQFFVVHHEMGHVQYYLQYKNLPHIFRSGANSGFHEAIGDVISMSVSTPKHLEKVGLLSNYEIDDEADINFLLKTSLQLVAFLPFSYSMDRWSWDVFRGKITPENYTAAWWNNRYNFQGLQPPVERSAEDFDPSAKFHINSNQNYIRYFVSNILQFQFYKSLCEKAGEYEQNNPQKPLYRCDIYQSLEAGKAFGKMLELGASVHWKEVLKSITGNDSMNASAMREYFKPLEDWLIADNENNEEFIGWEGGIRPGVRRTSEFMDNNEPKSSIAEKKRKLLAEPEQNVKESEDMKINAKNISRTELITRDQLEKEAQIFMDAIDEESSLKHNKYVKLNWNYSTNITDANKKAMLDGNNAYGAFLKDRWNRIQKWKNDWPSFLNKSLKRQFKLFSTLGTAALPEDKYAKLNFITTEMEEIYSTGNICDYKEPTKCDLSLEPEITKILKTKRDYDELVHVWKAWRDSVGKPVKALYSDYVKLSNEAAVLNGFPSMAEMWMESYESETFEKDVAQLIEQLSPLYKQLHAYTRRKLREVYGVQKLPERGPIPAHLLGNMWAQNWANIYDILIPYPNKTFVDVTDAMKEQNFTPRLMFEKADDFFASMGLKRVPLMFWNNSVIEKPTDRKIICHASAWDFSDGEDFRIKQCTVVDMGSYFTVHHELGHVQYSIQYKDLPFIFRSGANPGFHEAVGDVLSLSVSTPKHLQKVGLLTNYQVDEEADINFLMKSGLENIAFLPFGYLVDKWRWDVFREKITVDNYNSGWWQLRYDLQGITPPVLKTEEDFDPAGKYHIASNTKYISYFVSHILKFQFYKTLCQLAGEYEPGNPQKPLYRCDIYQSLEAGKAFGNMLKLGASLHWSEALKRITGSDTIDISALREYFQPLEDWLIEDNKKHGEYIGWEGGYEALARSTSVNLTDPAILPDAPVEEKLAIGTINKEESAEGVTNLLVKNDMENKTVIDKQLEQDAEALLEVINAESLFKTNAFVKVNWNYQTNITDATKKALVDETNSYGAFSKDRWNKIQKYKTSWPSFSNESLRRQFKLYSVLGTSVLPEDEYAKFTAVNTEMAQIQFTGKICDFKNASKCDLSLEPDLKEILKSSRDYNELTHVWKAWRDVTGIPIRPLFIDYIRLSNDAAVLNGFPSMAEMWMYDYESETFENDVKKLLDQMFPLYQQIHAYARRKLRMVYGSEKVSERGPIPAHLLGSMQALTWENILDILVPYPNKTSIDITENMRQQGLTPRLMFEKADDFFASMGMERVPISFWNKSVIEKPIDREIVCHASAFDFYDGKDFRIKQCTKVNMEDFFTVHHEMGHIQYYMQYKNKHFPFRGGANPGFHEAIGDVLSLSVSTPKHLEKIGLMTKNAADPEADINFLMKAGLERIVFLPAAYVIDKWRWEVFRGKITPDNFNDAWWKLRKDIQGFVPPVPRSSSDLDPAAIYHVAANVPYIRYFVSFILQFQFHKSLCLLAEQYEPNNALKPLHQCDIYESLAAGKAFSDTLQLGASVHWTEALKKMTGSDKMDASPIREYFKPLEDWLIEDNKKNGEFIGWEAN